MNFNEYQDRVQDTWISNNEDLNRMVLGLCEEAGEIAGKYKKAKRGDYIGKGSLLKKDFEKEAGDLLYYLAIFCEKNGLKLGLVAKRNLEKLAKRLKGNKIKGSGDNR